MNPVTWFEIYVQDIKRATSFYEAMLDIKLEPLGAPDGHDAGGLTMMAFPMDMNKLGAGGALVQAPDVPSGPGGTMVYFGCDDVANEVSRIEAAGGRIFREKFSIGEYGDVAMGFDTEGNMFGLHNAPAGAQSC